MDRTSSNPGPESDGPQPQDPALRSTIASDRRQANPRTGPDERGSGRRDLIADVVYYQSSRDLFGGAREAPRLGKYSLERVLGSGAFGAVILGRNPDTGGEVAIKILRAGDRVSEREAHRLDREAKALAQLAHPNVVPVYDAGVADGARYVVMRRVSGTTLRQAQKGRPWRDIIDLYVAAARGLAAVHAAGLIHRDFKADNVLVGDDGQVMLADFGLVCLAEAGDERRSGIPTGAEMTALADRLTRSGEIFGTPAYMSPEAIESAQLGPRSDLFSFAASLFEALYGVLPFEGETLLALYLGATQGHVRPRPADSEVPLWIDATIREALAVDPMRRPASCKALISALDFRARERAEADARARTTRRKRFVVGVGLAAFAGLGLGLATMRPVDPCGDPEARIAGAWADRRAGIEAAVLSLDSAPAAAMWPRVRDLLDGWSADWSASFSEICGATFHRGSQSEALFDARVGCLQQRRHELVALVRRLDSVSVDSLGEALAAAARLDRPGACVTATGAPTPTPEQERALAPIREAIAEARVQELIGDYPAADQTSAAAVREARRASFVPILIEALIASGRAKWLVHAGDAARAALVEALDLAEASARDDLAADASNLLTKIAALELHEAALGDEWARQSQRKLARIDADAWRRAELFNNRGLLAFHVAGDLDAALLHHRQALALRQSLPGEARLLIADSHQNLANALAARGELDDALYHYGESHRLNREVLGDAHPRLADDAFNQAVTFRDEGDYTHAVAYAQEALTGYLRGADPRSLSVANAHRLLSVLLEEQQQLSAALAHARLAAEIVDENREASAGTRAIALERIGSIERKLGDDEAAIRSYNRALEIVGDAEPFTAERIALFVNRASTLTNLDRMAEAHADCDRALALAGDSPAHARLRAAALRAKGRAFHYQRDPVRARAPLEEALALLRTNADPPALAEVCFLLAQVLVSDEEQRPRALALAQESLAYYRGLEDDDRAQRVLTWIDAH